MNKVSLVVLNYKDYYTTSKFLDYSKGFESINNIIVVDNNSQDESYEKLLKYEDNKIKVIKSNQNGGYSAGNNIGIKYAIENYNSDYIIISNPDVIFKDEIIKSMIKEYDNYEKLAIVAPRMIQSKANPEVAWKIPSLRDDIISSFEVLSRVIGDPCKYDEEYLNQDKVFVEVVPGSFFMISSKAIQDVNYLDESVFLYCEERILGLKLKEKGYRNMLLNNISYIHDHSISISKSIKSEVDKYKILYISKLIYNKKYLKVRGIKLLLIKLLFKLAIIEKYFIFKVKKVINNK